LERHWRAGQKRVLEFGEWLCTDVLKYVPHRQWVFSPPEADVPYSKKIANLWDVRPKPPPRANDPPTEAIIIYDEFTSPSADDYIINVDNKARFRYLEGYCLC
jgi:hypothetical protein